MRLTPPGQTGQILSAAEFAALMAPFDPFERKPHLAVAVSGGRDSLALMLLADEWARERAGGAIALIVDHGLRAESATEAGTTRDLLRRHGIDAEVLRWSGAKPARGIQEAARAARYRLLFEACRQRGILHLLVAHHADDQDETIAMRVARATGPDGLAGMAALVEQREARLLRPLLEVRRARLTATLRARSVQWIDDPSNVDTRFERARLRQSGVVQPAPTGAAGRSRAERERTLAAAALDVLDGDVPGKIAIDGTAYGRLPRDLQIGLLSRVAQALGGSDHPPRRSRLETAAFRLARGGDRGKSGKSQDFTLSRCRLMLRQLRAGGPGGHRLRWIVGPESGRNDRNKGVQPLIPAAYFACGAPEAHHLDC